MSNRDQGVGPRKSNKTGPTIHDIRVDNSPLPPDRATARPWRMEQDDDKGRASYAVYGDEDNDTLPPHKRAYRILHTTADGEVSRANALLIVLAVNSHSSLLARMERLEGALKEVLRVVGDCYLDGPLPDFMRLAVANARAALSNHSPAGEGENK